MKNTLLTGIENFLKICGDIIVILCRMNCEQSCAEPEKNPLASVSNLRPCSGGIEYLERFFKRLRLMLKQSLIK